MIDGIDENEASRSKKLKKNVLQRRGLPLANDASTTIFDPKKARKRGEGELLVALCQHLK